MTVCDLKKGERAVVIKVELQDEERARLRYLNVYTGAKISVLKVSRFKKIWVLQAKSAKFALSRDVAQGVRVWRT